MLLNTLGPTSAIDTKNSAGIVLQFTGGGSGEVSVEVSVDATDGSWRKVNVREAGGGSLAQIIADGVYTLPASARYLRLNALDINFPWTVIAQGRSSPADVGQNVLDLAADDATQVRIGVRTELKKDANNALVLSDAPSVTYGAGSANNAVLIASFDTIGYASVTLQLFGAFAATVNWYTSNDVNSGWVGSLAWPVNGAASPVSAATATGMWSIPCTGRYLRVVITAYTSGTVQVSLLPRMVNPVHADSTPSVGISGTPTVNLTQVGTNNVASAGVIGVMSIGGNVAPSAAPTANPIPIGSVDGSSLTRRILSDALGRLQIVGKAPTGVSQGDVIALPTYNAPDVKGLNESDFLLMLWAEMQVISYYMSELPRMLNDARATWDSPDVVRNDVLNNPPL
jgi:hypothetical protein